MQLMTMTANGMGLILPMERDRLASRTSSSGEAHITLQMTTPSKGHSVSVIHCVDEPAIANPSFELF
jgi:hypothetical protein